MSLKVFLPDEPLSLIPPAKQFSLKQEIDINVAALKAYDAGDYELALKTFEVCAIPEPGLMVGNCGFFANLFQHGDDPCDYWRA